MNKLYKLYTDYENYSSFNEIYEKPESNFYMKNWNWKKIDLENFIPLKMELHKSEAGKKNYQFDICVNYCLLILSKRAVEVLKPILEGKGQFIPLETPSKRKIYIGFYPNNVYSNDLADLSKSDWGENEKGKLFFKMAFKKYPQDEYIFVVDGSALVIYATEKFKELVEKNELKGLYFEEVEIVE